MKINEINAPDQLDEGLGSALIGAPAAAAIKGLFTGKGAKHTLAQDIFLKDFYQDAVTSLDNGISGGLVNPKLSNAISPSVTTPPGTSSSAATSSSTTPPGDTAQPAPAGRGQRPGAVPIDQEYGKVVGAMRKVQSGSKPLPTKMITTISNDIKNARYNKDWAINTGNKIINLAQKGYNVSGLKTEWDKITAIGRRQQTVQENTYLQLNALFESILTVSEQVETGQKTVSEYMTDWFNAYMTGTNWESYKKRVFPLIQNIENTYKRDKGKSAIKQLAKVAYAISKASPTIPAGAKNIPTSSTPTSTMGMPKTAEELAAAAETLKQTNPAEYSKYTAMRK